MKRSSRSRSRSKTPNPSISYIDLTPPATNVTEKVNSTKKTNTKTDRKNVTRTVSSINKTSHYNPVPSAKKSIIYPKVDSVLLELPYRGLFDFTDANTINTLPDNNFRTLFDQLVRNSNNLKKLCNQKNKISVVSNTNVASSAHSVNKLKVINFDDYEIDTWYKSPYPKQLNVNSIMYICPHCLSYFDSSFTLSRHKLKCSFKSQPAGREIYRDSKEKISIFEIDGRKNVIFCQNLCLLAKLFLNSKTLYYDVEPFMFYVLYEFNKDLEFKFIGYFSKEKLNSTGYNLSCIMTLPIYQRRGFGNFLIDFSYLLSKREFKLGTPEKPLSDLGLLSYRNYWKISIIKEIYKILFVEDRLKSKEAVQISIDDISNLTGMSHDDVVVGLEQLNCFVFDESKQKYYLIFEPKLVKSLYLTWLHKKSVKLVDDYLLWKPIILGPSGGINTNSTMVVTDHNQQQFQQAPDSTVCNSGAQLMKNISVISNFLNDDVEDDRDLEVQTMEKIVLQNAVSTSTEEINLADTKICYPGMKLSDCTDPEYNGNGESNLNGVAAKWDASFLETRCITDVSPDKLKLVQQKRLTEEDLVESAVEEIEEIEEIDDDDDDDDFDDDDAVDDDDDDDAEVEAEADAKGDNLDYVDDDNDEEEEDDEEEEEEYDF